MKTIFVYGILQKDISAKNFGIEDKYYIGRGILSGYKRYALTRINKSKNKEDSVHGDIFEVPDDIEENLYKFEHGFGYNREVTEPILENSNETYKCISYILPSYE